MYSFEYPFPPQTQGAGVGVRLCVSVFAQETLVDGKQFLLRLAEEFIGIVLYVSHKFPFSLVVSITFGT